MSKVTDVVDVMFRVERAANTADSEGRKDWTETDWLNEVIAVFPGLAGTMDEDTCMCYVHLGQHSHCVLDHMTSTYRIARPEEYEPLRKELVRVGYTQLNVVEKPTKAHLHARRKQIRRPVA
jgi:hypothetical protein